MNQVAASDPPTALRILVTGAAGFLGRAVVAAAREAGHPVTVIVRSDRDLPAIWGTDPQIAVRVMDLATEPGPNLAAISGECDAVIHAAAATGDDAAHARDTLAASENLINAMMAQISKTGHAARLILLSSFSVYGYTAIPDHATLDETNPTEPDPHRRDAYTRAKLGQEWLAIRAAQHDGLDLWIMRPGAIYGPEQTTSARLGIARGGRVFCPGGDVPVPAIHVDHCATTLVRAVMAEFGNWPDDLPILQGGGHVQIINLLDPDPPEQRHWLAVTGQVRLVFLPRRALMKLAALLSLASDLWPALGRRIPTGLSEASLAARFKPLRFSTARAEDRLDHRPDRSFETAMQACLTRLKGPE